MPTPKTILIIDDDDDLREALAEQLNLHEEFKTQQASTAADGVRMGREIRADLILLDVDLPDMDGREACRLLRKDGVSTPVIMLTAQSADADAILGLDAGANDYVTKPFRFAVLLARIRAHLRSHEQSEDAVFSIGPYEFHIAKAASAVTLKGEPVNLGFTVAALSDTSLTWTYDGVDYLLSSQDLTKDEMVAAAKSMQGQSSK